MERWQAAQNANNMLTVVALRIGNLLSEIQKVDKEQDLAQYYDIAHKLADSVEHLLEATETTMVGINLGLSKDVQELKNAYKDLC